MNTKNLVTIQRINNISKVKSATIVELAQVLGYESLVKKGTFNVGDLCVFCTINSVLPKIQIFEFLRMSGFRVNTELQRKMFIQGLILPLWVIDKIPGLSLGEDYKTINVDLNVISGLNLTSVVSLEEGLDLTDLVKATPWVPKESDNVFSQISKKSNIDEMQNMVDIQQNPDIVTILNDYVALEMIDGVSCFLGKRNNEFFFGKDEYEFKLDPIKNIHSHYIIEKRLDHSLKNYNDILIQGTIAGPKIKNNRYNKNELSLYISYAYDIKEKRAFTYDELISFCDDVKIKPYPKLNFNVKDTLADIMLASNTPSELNVKVSKKGIVFVNPENLKNAYNVLSPLYLYDTNEG